jgi:hypothetical protein
MKENTRDDLVLVGSALLGAVWLAILLGFVAFMAAGVGAELASG